MLLKEHLDIVFALILGLLVSNLIASVFGLIMANALAKVTFIDIQYIVPVALALCFVGSYAIRQNIWDVFLTVVAGVFGYGLLRFGFSHICLVIGFILGIVAETEFHKSLMISYGSYAIFFSRAISLVLFSLLVLVLLIPFIRMTFEQRQYKA